MFSNLVLTENTANAIAVVVDDNAIKKKISYFEGLIGCFCVFGFLYFSAMYAISLWTNQNNENKKQIKILQSIIETQQKQIERLEIKLKGTIDEVTNINKQVETMNDMMGFNNEKIEEITKEKETEMVLIGLYFDGCRKILSSCRIPRTSTTFNITNISEFYLEELLKLNKLKVFDFGGYLHPTIKKTMYNKPVIVNLDFGRIDSLFNVIKELKENEDLKLIVEHLQKCGTQMLWHGQPLNFN